jgi:biopolymer transport protein ExbD
MIRLSVLLVFFLAHLAFAQEDGVVSSPDTQTAAEETDEDESIDFEELEDFDINADHTEEDEDVFVPTDEVSYQQSVPFPTDI